MLDDPELVTWQAYTARAWPTLVLVDPEGYVVAQYAGEGHAHAIDALLAELRQEHRRPRAPCSRATRPTSRRTPQAGDLRFPAKAVAPARRGLPRRRRRPPQPRRARAPTPRPSCAGSAPASAGSSTAAADEARFNEPNGLCLLPDDVAAEVGYDVVVADTVNHALRGVRAGDRPGHARWPATAGS